MLEIKNLCVSFSSSGEIGALQDVNLRVEEGSRTVLIGETGSGKSVLLLAVLRLLPSTARVTGEVLFSGEDLLRLKTSRLMGILGSRIAYIPQGSGNCLNPLLQTGYQVGEALIAHRGYTKKQAMARSIELLQQFKLGREEQLACDYPHVLSGGMKQRVLIAMGVAASAELLLADEPTKGLDRDKIDTVAACFIQLAGKTLLCVTHDLSFAREVGEQICVMYASRQMEYASREDFFREPLHPYSQALLLSQPENGLRCNVRFAPPHTELMKYGCLFFDNCPYRMQVCRKEPPMTEVGKRKVRCWLYAHAGA